MKRVMCIWLPHWPLQYNRLEILQRLEPQRREPPGSAAPESAASVRPGDPVPAGVSAISGVRSESSAPAAIPLVLYASSGQRGARVVDCSRLPAQAGVRPGMPLAEARMLLERCGREARARREAHQTPRFVEWDPQADRAALRQLVPLCQQYSPSVGLSETEPIDSLFVDITGCGHLFGGETELAEQVWQAFSARGLQVRLGIADTLGAAWALARSRCRASPGRSAFPYLARIPSGRQREALEKLPVSLLRLEADVIERLHDLDLRTIGRLQKLPRVCLPSRFGPDVLMRLDQALGRREELFQVERLPEPLAADWKFEEPLADQWAIRSVIDQLLDRLLWQLAPRGAGVLQLECRLKVSGGEESSFSLALIEPDNSPRNLRELLSLRLERLSLPAGVLEVRLQILKEGPLGFRQRELPVSPESGRPGGPHGDVSATELQDIQRHWNRLLERLSSRLGEQAVVAPVLAADAQPEYAVHYQPAVGARAIRRKVARRAKAGGPRFSLVFPFSRPLRIWNSPVAIEVMSLVPDGPPIQFSFEGRAYVIARHWGPERIQTGWWRNAPINRDYYRIETGCGRWFWIFRDRAEQAWFLQGCFA